MYFLILPSMLTFDSSILPSSLTFDCYSNRKYNNDSDVFSVNDTLEQNGQPSILNKISVISFNIVFLNVCGGLIFIAKQFIKSIPPGRKLVCTIIFQGLKSQDEFFQATFDVQYICLHVSLVTAMILPIATMMKIIYFESFSFLSTFLIIEAFKVSFVLGRYIG